MERIGPVVAIGKPGERLPELGAARLYVGNDEWQEVVRRFMREAALIVIRAGETAGVWWEIEEALAHCPPQRVIIVALGPPAALEAFERRFAEAFGKPAAPPPVARPAVATLLNLLFPYGRSSGKIIYFDAHANPYEEPLVYHVTLPGLVLSPYRPYRDSLQAAFKKVFAKLGLPWSAKRSQAAAVLLALFGGVFGLHHFYTGHTRRGLWHLGFFWLFVPTIILGWIDAVRLALLDDSGFQAQLKIGRIARDER
jgi:TM2 domain-containing membrane protein YozV